jgi:antitoxin MazE
VITMKARIVPIGNSRGIRIPKPVLAQTGITTEVELDVEGSRIILRAPRLPRAGWDEAFRAMRARGDDLLVHGDTTGHGAWDEDEWRW